MGWDGRGGETSGGEGWNDRERERGNDALASMHARMVPSFAIMRVIIVGRHVVGPVKVCRIYSHILFEKGNCPKWAKSFRLAVQNVLFIAALAVLPCQTPPSYHDLLYWVLVITRGVLETKGPCPSLHCCK